MLIDEANPGVAKRAERLLEIVHAIGDVMHAFAASGEEPTDRRVGTERAEELDVGRADAEQHLVDALMLDALAMRGLDAEGSAVLLDRGFQVLDRDADVIDLAEQHVR